MMVKNSSSFVKFFDYKCQVFVHLNFNIGQCKRTLLCDNRDIHRPRSHCAAIVVVGGRGHRHRTGVTFYPGGKDGRTDRVNHRRRLHFRTHELAFAAMLCHASRAPRPPRPPGVTRERSASFEFHIALLSARSLASRQKKRSFVLLSLGCSFLASL